MKKLAWVFAALMAVSAVYASMELESARLYKQQGEYEKSLEFYNAELQKNPTNADALFERGDLLGKIARSPDRIDLAKKLAGDVPSPERALIERMLGDFNQAKSTAGEKIAKKLNKQIDEIITDDWTKFYVNAKREDSAKAYDKALEQVNLAILLMPNDWRAYGEKAQILDAAGKDAEAVSVWEAAYKSLLASNWEKEKAKEFVQVSNIMRSRLLEGYYTSGEAAANQARELGDSAGSSGQKDSLSKTAMTAFLNTIGFADDVLKTDPQNSKAIEYKAFALAQLASSSRYSEQQRDSLRAVAVKALDDAQKARPDYSMITYFKGQFCLQLGDTACAMKEFTHYLEMEPKDRDARFVVGVLYLEGGSFLNTEKARDEFKTLTEQYPEDAAAWTNYGVALLRLGDNAGGKKAIEKAKSLGGTK